MADVLQGENKAIERLFLMLVRPERQNLSQVNGMHTSTANMIRSCPLIPQYYNDQTRSMLSHADTLEPESKFSVVFSFVMAAFTIGFLLATLINMTAGKKNPSRMVV